MQFDMLSPVEAALVYLGIAVHAVTSLTLGGFAGPIIAVNIILILSRGAGNSRAVMGAVGYAISGLFIALAFLPASFGFGAGQSVPATSVRSYAAIAGGGPIQTAADTDIVPTGARSMGQLPILYAAILEGMTDLSIGLAQELNSNSARPFSAVQPMQWLLETNLSMAMTAAARDFAQACYVPAIAKFNQNAGGSPLSYQDLSPWTGVLGGALASIQKVPGIETGSYALVSSNLATGPDPIPCTQYAARISSQVTLELQRRTTESGTPMSAIWQEYLGLLPIEAARYLAFREIAIASGPLVPAPSLTGAYTTTKVASVATSIIGKIFGSGRGGGKGAAVGAGVSEVSRSLEVVSGSIGKALVMIKIAPYALGVLNLVLIALSSVVFLAALAPGGGFRVIISFFILLALTTSTPLWWSLIDLAAQAAGDFGRHSLNDNPLAAGADYFKYTATIVVAVPTVAIGLMGIATMAGMRMRRMFI